MSDYGESIIEEVPQTSSIHKNEDAYNLIDKTVGEWLDDYENKDWFEQFNLNDATGKYLDLHGNDFGVKRKLDEDDESYRNRIIYQTLAYLTVNYLINVYNLEIYTYVPNFNVNANILVSDNTNLNKNGFMTNASNEIKEILNKKFVIGGGLHWF